MVDKEKTMESFIAKVEADEGVRAKVEAALEARDAKALASIAAGLGFELEESDFEIVEEGDCEHGDARSLSLGELEGVAGGMKISQVRSPQYISTIKSLIFRTKRAQD